MPDSLVTNTAAAQTQPAGSPVVFGSNIAVNGTSISHEENTAEIILTEQGLYLMYYNGTVSGPADAVYPLTVTIAAYLNGSPIPDSSTTVTLTAAGVETPVNGYAFIRVGTATTLPAAVTVQTSADSITWTYAEAIVGRSV